MVTGLARVARPLAETRGVALNLREVAPIRRRIQVAQSAVPRNAEAGAARVNLAKGLMLGDDASN